MTVGPWKKRPVNYDCKNKLRSLPLNSKIIYYILTKRPGIVKYVKVNNFFFEKPFLERLKDEGGGGVTLGGGVNLAEPQF